MTLHILCDILKAVAVLVLHEHFFFLFGRRIVMNDGKGMSIAALVLGILSAIFAWWGLYIGIVSLVCGIVGIVLAVKGKKAAAAAGAPTGMATAGLVLAIIGTSLSVIGVIACGICVICSASATKGIEDALGSGALDDLSECTRSESAD